MQKVGLQIKLRVLIVLGITITSIAASGFILSTSESVNDSQTVISKSFWQLTNWNTARPLEWYTSSYAFVANVTANINSTIEYDITSQNSTLNTGNLTLGNLTNFQTNSLAIASNLVLSIYPWYPALVTDTNWTQQTIDAKNAANDIYTQGNLKITNVTFKTGADNFYRKAIEFQYNENKSLGNQNTTLIYDIGSGVLLYGNSSIKFSSLFVVTLNLLNIKLITVSNTTASTSTPFYIIIPFIVIFLITSIIRIRKRRR